MKKLKTPPSECYTLRIMHVYKTTKERQCFGCGTLFPKGCKFTIHKVIGINEIYNMYLCEKCEYFNLGCNEDIYTEGELKKMMEEENWHYAPEEGWTHPFQGGKRDKETNKE